MSASEDSLITKDDILGYLEYRNPENFEDAEQEFCYRMISHHWEKNLEKINGEHDLTMAKYYLEQAWIIEGELDKGYTSQ